ncbi:hypothetical protein L484_023293 [Morus notabilis]|uniref:Uncharacterized protein n=1 Tax=Morus notabilis TaxID=981085 RepID=W9RWD7_9ROSA|nr:hypothetical protein L484_023293 [Morus notabilis]
MHHFAQAQIVHLLGRNWYAMLRFETDLPIPYGTVDRDFIGNGSMPTLWKSFLKIRNIGILADCITESDDSCSVMQSIGITTITFPGKLGD